MGLMYANFCSLASWVADNFYIFKKIKIEFKYDFLSKETHMSPVSDAPTSSHTINTSEWSLHANLCKQYFGECLWFITLTIIFCWEKYPLWILICLRCTGGIVCVASFPPALSAACVFGKAISLSFKRASQISRSSQAHCSRPTTTIFMVHLDSRRSNYITTINPSKYEEEFTCAVFRPPGRSLENNGEDDLM